MFNRSDFLIKDKSILKQNIDKNLIKTENPNYIFNVRKKYFQKQKPYGITKSILDTTRKSVVKSIIEQTVDDYRSKSLIKNTSWSNYRRQSISSVETTPIIKAFVANRNNSIATASQKIDNKQDPGELTPIEYDNFYSYNDYRNRALSAVTAHKIFNVSSSRTTVRNALIQRGWVEKKAPFSHPSLKNATTRYLATNARPGNEFETMFLSRIIGDVPVNFVWGNARGLNILDTKYRSPYRCGVKRCKHNDFTNKEGLIACYDQIHWSTIDASSDVQIPRSYRLVNNEECKDFLDNYRLTCCQSFVKFFTEKSYTEFTDKKGLIPINIIEFALKRIRNKIMYMQHIDLDNSIRGKKINNEENIIKDADWDRFCYQSNQVIKGEERILINKYNDLDRFISKGKILLNNCIKYWPRLLAEGYNNLWILKPGFCCRGIGIIIKDSYENIIKFSEQNLQLRYIVQKYIEKPMLIYKTKFDIRQYILITIANNKFHIWMYKNCYLRFSSQEYQLNELSKSIHVTNNCVQRHLKNGTTRSDKLPPHNMWTLEQFKTYLRSNNRSTLWDMKIYPQMKSILKAIIVASLENTDLITNTFALYGADFLLDFNYNVHLLEINASPDMAPTTCVTSIICPQVQEDVIKVVIDLPQNKDAYTGDFELIYHVNCEQPPNDYFVGTITGKCMSIITNSESVTNNNNNNSTDKKKLLRRKFKKRKPISKTSSAVKDINVENSEKGSN